MNRKMNINKVLLVIIVILLVVLIALAVLRFVGNEGNFYAVYLATGDLYFGKLVKFPSLGLKQVYLFQVNPEDEIQPISVQRFSQTFWGPEDFVRLNRDMIVWKAKLDSRSQLMQLIRENPDLVPQQMPEGEMFQQAPPGGFFEEPVPQE